MPDVLELVAWVDNSEDATVGARQRSERDRDYYDGEQLTTTERNELKKRGPPPIIITRLQRKIDFLNGIEKQTRTNPKAYPRTPVHEEDSEACTDAIRYVCDNTNFDQVRSGVWENLLVEGAGGCEVIGEVVGNRIEIKIQRYRWDRLFWDPHSVEADYSDAKYIGTIIWMDMQDALDRYGEDVKDILEHTIGEIRTEETYDDRPKHHLWADRKRKRVKVAHIRFQEGGEWRWAIFTKGGIIQEGVSPYVDENGKPECELIIQSAYCNRENERYGVVRSMISAQDEINKRRSKMLHLAIMRQTMGETGAVQDIRHMKAEMAKADGHIEVSPGAQFQILDTKNASDLGAQANLLAHATQEIDLMGPNAAMEGRDTRNISGRAILAQQQGGMVELATMLDALRDFNLRVYRQVWNRIRQFWTEERWVRVTDNERNMKFVAFNQMARDPMGNPAMDMFGQGMMDPNAIQPVNLDVDIILEEVPDTITMQQEQFDALVGLANAGVVFPPEVYIEASELRNKKRLIEIITGGPENPEAQAAAQQQAQQAAELQNALIDNTEADTQRKIAQAAKDAAASEKLEAETDQIEAENVLSIVR